MRVLNKPLDFRVISLKKTITKTHVNPDAELWPTSADVGFHVEFMLILHSRFMMITRIDFALINPGRYGAQNLDLLLGRERGKQIGSFPERPGVALTSVGAKPPRCPSPCSFSPPARPLIY